jgi:hypothetical protein
VAPQKNAVEFQTIDAYSGVGLTVEKYKNNKPSRIENEKSNTLSRMRPNRLMY